MIWQRGGQFEKNKLPHCVLFGSVAASLRGTNCHIVFYFVFWRSSGIST